MAVKEKKKWSIKRKIFIGFIVVILVLLLQIPITIAVQNGKFAKGNKEEYSVSSVSPDQNSPLKGKTIIFLGSSVTYGSAASGESFVDYLEKKDGITAVKEAVSGTVLVDEDVWGKQSYITRMKTIDTDIQADAFVCQLSTNDATMKKSIGEISDSKNPEDFDTHTVAGAIEYVIAYAQETWNCPVVFYTGTKYENEHYAKMVDLLLDIQKKWGISVLDLWNDEEMNQVGGEDYKLYMVNKIHPSRAGYKEWWTPKFESFLYDLIGETGK